MKPENFIYNNQAISLSPDDLILVQYVSDKPGKTLILEGSCINQQGSIVQFKETFSNTSENFLETFASRLGYKALLSCVLYTNDVNVQNGSIYARLTLTKNPISSLYPNRKLLAQGYVSMFSSIGFGLAETTQSPSFFGYQDLINLTSPAAGDGAVIQPPNYNEFFIISCFITFTTNAAVANRRVYIHPVSAPTTPNKFYSGLDQAASLVRTYGFANGIVTQTAFFNNTALVAIPNLKCNYPYGFEINALNIDAGDSFNEGSALILRRIVPFT